MHTILYRYTVSPDFISTQTINFNIHKQFKFDSITIKFKHNLQNQSRIILHLKVMSWMSNFKLNVIECLSFGFKILLHSLTIGRFRVSEVIFNLVDATKKEFLYFPTKSI